MFLCRIRQDMVILVETIQKAFIVALGRLPLLAAVVVQIMMVISATGIQIILIIIVVNLALLAASFNIAFISLLLR